MVEAESVLSGRPLWCCERDRRTQEVIAERGFASYGRWSWFYSHSTACCIPGSVEQRRRWVAHKAVHVEISCEGSRADGPACKGEKEKSDYAADARNTQESV